MTIAEIANEIAEFSLARGWKNNDPNQLLVALNTEIGELSEHFLWANRFPDDLTEVKRTELAYELVDVLIYLLQISNKCGIKDLGKYYKDKIKRLALKYPVDITHSDWKNRHEEYKKSGKNKLYE